MTQDSQDQASRDQLDLSDQLVNVDSQVSTRSDREKLDLNMRFVLNNIGIPGPPGETGFPGTKGT